jgi:hypothetical protein
MKAKTILFLGVIIFASCRAKIPKEDKLSCGSFVVKSIKPDTTNSFDLVVNVFFKKQATNHQINYPSVLSILNSNGDKIATGRELTIYAQIDNSAANYALKSNLKELPKEGDYQVVFRYNDSYCSLPVYIKR